MVALGLVLPSLHTTTQIILASMPQILTPLTIILVGTVFPHAALQTTRSGRVVLLSGSLRHLGDHGFYSYNTSYSTTEATYDLVFNSSTAYISNHDPKAEGFPLHCLAW